MADHIEQVEELLDSALERLETSKADLFMPDGSKKYSDAVHEALLAGSITALHDVVGDLDEAINAEIATVNRLREAEEDDPIAHLTEKELQTANLRALFVQQDAEHLTLPQLANRLRGIIAAGNGKPDRAQAFLWSRAAGLRIGVESTRWREQHEGRAMPEEQRRQLTTIENYVSQLAAVVAPKSGISQAEAERRLKRAREAGQAARRRVRAVDGSDERLRQEMASQYRL